MRVEQCVGVGHDHGGFDGRDAECHAVIERRFGADFEKTREWRKTGALHLHAIHAEGQQSDRVTALGIGSESVPNLGRVPDHAASGFEAQSRRIFDCETQLAGTSLGRKRHGDQREQRERLPVQGG